MDRRWLQAEPRAGGWAAILRYKGTNAKLSGPSLRPPTIHGTDRGGGGALETLKRPSRVVVPTDSENVRNGITAAYRLWWRRNWRNAAGDRWRTWICGGGCWTGRRPLGGWRWLRGHARRPDETKLGRRR